MESEEEDDDMEADDASALLDETNGASAAAAGGAQQTPVAVERHVESNPVAQDVAVVELGREKNNEQLLNKYLILHCAKLHLTVTDASSGEYIPNLHRRMGNSGVSKEQFHS